MRVRLDWGLAGFGLLYGFASAGVVQKYAGTGAALALIVLGPLVGALAGAAVATIARYVDDRRALVAAGVVLALAIVALLVVYPHANTHVPNQGSDRDDAATTGARGFLHGENPYDRLTYLHQPLSQLPTLLVVAMPFVALFGSSAYALVVLLPLLYVLLRVLAPDARLALGWLLVALAAPTLLRDYLTGGDLLTNTVIVAGACVLVWRIAPRGPWHAAAAGVALGVALATRASFALICVPLLVAVLRRAGWLRALAVAVPAATVSLAIVLPFALTPSGSEALRQNNQIADVFGGTALVLTFVVLLGLVLAVATRRWTLRQLFGQAAAVQTAVLFAIVVDRSLDSGRADFSSLVSGYGVPAYLLGVAALAAGAVPAFASSTSASASISGSLTDSARQNVQPSVETWSR